MGEFGRDQSGLDEHNLNAEPWTSNRIASEMASTALFRRVVDAPAGKVNRPPMEPRLMIRPCPTRRIPGRTSWLIRISPKTFVSNCRRMTSSGIDSTAPDS